MTMKRAVLYARYSSDIQHDRSIDDQLALCQIHAKRENLKVVATFADRAKSGATLFDRPQLWELMQAAKRKEFDVVVVESLDRLSRDQEDLPGIHKRLEFADVKIRTCNEGETTKLHIGIRGLVSSLFLADLGAKVRRGHAGRVREGKFPGAVTYGYRAVEGKPGEREINPEQATVVQRIFTEYAAGRSPRKIAANLTRDGIPTPGGAVAWNHQTFIGGRYKRGIIGNELYIGTINWNTHTTIINPDTGKKAKRAAPTEDHITVDAPQLRIVPQDLWDAANAVRKGRGVAKFGPGGKLASRVTNNKEHLLSGLLRCECGSHMRITNTSRSGTSRVACAAAHQHATCANTKTYDLDVLQAEILACMREQLTSPERIQKAVRAFHDEWATRKRKVSGNLTTMKKRLADIEAATNRLVDALEKGTISTDTIVGRMNNLETERVALVERMRAVEAQNGSNVIELHPHALKAYCDAIDRLHLSFASNDQDHAQNRAAFRNIIDNIVVHPTAKRAPYEFTTYHRVEALMGMELFPKKRTTQEVLTDQGVTCSAFGNPGNPGLPISQQRNRGRIIAFGRWRAAA